MVTDVVESRGKQRTSTTKSRPSTATSSTSEISTKQGTTRNPQIPRPRPSTATASTSEASTSNVSSVQYATGSSYIGSSGTSISSRTSLSSLRESLPENPYIYDFSEISSATNIAPFLLNTVMGPALGIKPNPQAAAGAEKLLLSSLSKIESVWLKGNGKFLLGSSQPSIADLSLVCEIMQLEIQKKKMGRFLVSLCNIQCCGCIQILFLLALFGLFECNIIRQSQA